MEFLIKHKKDGQFRTFWNGWEQGVQLVANQEVWVMTGWEPIVYAARERGINAYYAVPEGRLRRLGQQHHPSQGRGRSRTFGYRAHASPMRCSPATTAASSAGCAAMSCPTDNNVAYAEAHSDVFDPKKVKELAEHVKAKFAGKVYWQNTRPDSTSSSTKNGGRSSATHEQPFRTSPAGSAGRPSSSPCRR